MTPEELAEARHYAACYQTGYVHDLMHNLLDHIDQQAARIAELGDTVAGPLKNITKMFETINADTIFSGIIQTWKNENDALKTRITELEADLKQEEHNSKAFMNKIGEQVCYIVDLENQIKALKKIAIKEKASVLFNGHWDSGLPVDCGYDAETEACRTEARRQLIEEHPEAFR